MNFYKNCTLTLVFILVLCGKSFSQGTFFLELDASLTTVGEFNYLHGMGVNNLSSYDEEASYSKACEKALSDLNSNYFLSIYIEEFRLGGQKDYSFPEISVRDTVFNFDDHNLQIIDSFAKAGDAYCTVGFQDYTTSGVKDVIPSIDDVIKTPIKVGNTWFALGASDRGHLNTNISWMRAKNNAVKDLTRVLKTMIQSSIIQLGDKEAEATYFKSNMIYEDIVVVKRYMTSDNLIVMVAIPNDNIVEY